MAQPPAPIQPPDPVRVGWLVWLLCALLVAQVEAQSTAPANPDPGALSPGAHLRESLERDRSPKVRATAALTLSELPPSPEIETALCRALADPEPAVRSAAAIALGKLGLVTAREPLTATLRDPDPLVVQAAQTALSLLAARAPQPAGLQATGPGLASARSGEEIARTLATHEPELTRCFLSQVKRDPHFTGLNLQLRIRPDGSVVLPFTSDPGLTEGLLLRCLTDVLTQLRFPPADGGDQVITIPMQVNR